MFLQDVENMNQHIIYNNIYILIYDITNYLYAISMALLLCVCSIVNVLFYSKNIPGRLLLVPLYANNLASWLAVFTPRCEVSFWPGGKGNIVSTKYNTLVTEMNFI